MGLKSVSDNRRRISATFDMMPPQPETDQKREELRALTGLRGLTALHICIYHFYCFFGYGGSDAGTQSGKGWTSNQPLHNNFNPGDEHPESSWVYYATQRGYVGVATFFMLSGFVMIHVYASRGVAAWQSGKFFHFTADFYIARFARVMPMYIVSIACLLPESIAVWSLSSKTWPEPENGALCWALSLSALQAWSPSRAVMCTSPLLWSVSSEMFFYFTFPFLLVVVYYLGFLTGNSVVRVVKSVAVVILGFGAEVLAWYAMYKILVISSVVPYGYQKPTNLPYGFPLVRWPEFIMGIAIGLAFNALGSDSSMRNLSGRTWAIITDVVSLVLLALLGWGWDGTGGIPFFYSNYGMSFGIWYWLTFLPLALWICGLANGRGFTACFLASPVMHFLGRISYCIYVMQFNVLVYAAWIYRRDLIIHAHGRSYHGMLAVYGTWGDLAKMATLPQWTLLPILLVVLLVSYTAHKFVEEPMRRIIVSKFMQHKQQSETAITEALKQNAVDDVEKNIGSPRQQRECIETGSSGSGSSSAAVSVVS